jgi:hypothetical protein
VQTDSLGRYFISRIKPGIYQIAASAKDYFSSMGNGIKVVADSTTIVIFKYLQKKSPPPFGGDEPPPPPIIWKGVMIKCDKKCFFKKSQEEIIKLEKEYLNKKYRRVKNEKD